MVWRAVDWSTQGQVLEPVSSSVQNRFLFILSGSRRLKHLKTTNIDWAHTKETLVFDSITSSLSISVITKRKEVTFTRMCEFSSQYVKVLRQFEEKCTEASNTFSLISFFINRIGRGLSGFKTTIITDNAIVSDASEEGSSRIIQLNNCHSHSRI